MVKVMYVCTSADGAVTNVFTLAEARILKEKNGGDYRVEYVPFEPTEK